MGKGIVITVYYRRVFTKNQLSHSFTYGSILMQDAFIVQSAYKLSEDFAKPYFHKYCTEIHDVTTI